ncbi:MAG: DUF4388 domain-containing protein [Nitrospirae bacterium]|nr:DUF4388 domain-containing protein [Nitrospirota bacterium]
MKKVRLDEILLRMGLINEGQIKKALLRQKSRGGKLGAHLMYYRFLTEEQLIQALSEQFEVSGILLSGYDIPTEVVEKIPVNIAEENAAIPFQFEHEKGILHVAMAEPGNMSAISAVKRASGASKVIANIAPETVIRSRIAFYYRGHRQPPSMNHIIDLPDLFEDEEDAPGLQIHPGRSQPNSRVLMFTKQVFLKNTLPSIFEREGFNLSVLTATAKIAESLMSEPFHRILVSGDAKEEFDAFIAGQGRHALLPEVTVFRTVGSALMENSAPYNKMLECLLKAVQYIAEQRMSHPLPYALISNEIIEVSRTMGLSRIATDGLRIAVYLLTPSINTSEHEMDASGSEISNMFSDIDTSIHLAKSLDFPWDITACLNYLKTDASDKDSPELKDDKQEPAIGAGILALAWYRHHILRNTGNDSRGNLDILKSRIRRQAGRLASSSVVEAYIRTLDQSGKMTGAGRDIFIVGEAASLSSNLNTKLNNHGFRIVEAQNLQEARKLYLRRRPGAILIYVDDSLSKANEFCRYIREDAGETFTVLFAVTRRCEPSFLLNLMDTWFSDVITLPINAEIAVARISRTLSLREKGAASPAGHGFSATFSDLSFVDLVQSLGSGAKNVRMQVEHSRGSQADIFFRQGRIVYAECGDDKGADAVYKVIRWQDDGNFRIEPIKEFPPDNVSESNDYILLEGARLLDEHEAEV